MIDGYDWSGGREAMWRFGPGTGPAVLLILPPFEEANRTRTIAVTLARMLATRGVAALLPDLPGQGESLRPTETATLADWRAAIAAVTVSAGRPVVSAAIRAGVLLDHDADVVGRWHLAPQDGQRLVRELSRVAQSVGGIDRADPHVTIAGNRITTGLLAELEAAAPVDGHPLRIVRIGTDPGHADLRIDAVPPWRRAEPGDDPLLAEQLADDLAAWSRACVGW